MTRYIMTIVKWLPPEMQEQKDVFRACKSLKIKIHELCIDCSVILQECSVKRAATPQSLADNMVLNRLQLLCDEIDKVTEIYSEVWQKFQLGKSDEIQEFKTKTWQDILWEMKTKLVYHLKAVLNVIFHVFAFSSSNNMPNLILRISLVYNNCLGLSTKHKLAKNLSICSNTCPYLMYPLRKISVTRLLQLLVQNRAEQCAHKLIDCLLDAYKSSEGHNHDGENSSDDSSLEIYQAITKHMSPFADAKRSVAANKNNAVKTVDNSGLFKTQELIVLEQQNALDLLNVAMKVAPGMLGNDAIKKGKSGEIKVSTRAQKKVLEYYQQILWGEVGNFLEHIILWWSSSPLAARPPKSSLHLGEWINRFVPTADVPQFILSALTTLADALGVHVTSTLWDQRFRLALVAAKTTCNPQTGSLFCGVLEDLVLLCNQFEVTSDWIMGAPLDELPLVEQIPVLHRLDHSVHTTRLWAANETKKIANSWNMAAFFKVTHSDIVNCLTELNTLRLTDYTMEIEKGGLDVHVEVCAKMRAKLASEVKENIQKLKETPKECIDCLASICRMISLTNLHMIFPDSSYWRQNGNTAPATASPYVTKYLNQILQPVLAATNDLFIYNMALKLMCESWLDHIYVNKIKFSRRGALQLLCDFAYVSKWISECGTITQEMRNKMLKNEVLRRCEGVGKLLLRSPGEHIKMNDSSKKPNKSEKSSSNESKELMPAEMYVPNQEQWLELRANRSTLLFKPPLCCGHVKQ